MCGCLAAAHLCMLWWFCSLGLVVLSSWPLSITQACRHVSVGMIKTSKPHVWGASLLSLPSCHTSHHRSCSESGFSFPLGLTFLSGNLKGASGWRTPSHLIYSYNQCPSDGWSLTHYICFFICAGDDRPEEEVYRLAHGHICLSSPGRRNHRSRSGGQVSDDNNDTCLY